MSVQSMAQMASEDAKPPRNPLSLLAAYIPSEAIAVYLAALGLLVPTAEATADQVARIRLICLIAGLGVALLIAVISVKTQPGVGTFETWRRRFIVALLAAVAFGVWTAATPNFFYEDVYLTIAFSQWAAFVAVIVTVFLPVIAKALGVREITANQAPGGGNQPAV